MATHKSAVKRARQNVRRRDRNRHVRSGMHTVVKQFRQALEASDPEVAEKLRLAERAIRKAASKGVIPKRRASRKVSRLARSLNASQTTT